MNTDLLSRLNEVERKMVDVNLRPKDAATLLILRRQKSGEPLVLMGRRHRNHRFMPGMFVFPGGRVDPGDSRAGDVGEFNPVIQKKLLHAMKGPKTLARSRAIAIAAIRETYEEAGLFVGRKAEPEWKAPMSLAPFAEMGVKPDLESIRLIARAITPPRRPRRFDTRFLAVFEDSIVAKLPDQTFPSGELEEIHWLPLNKAKNLELPTITLVIIEELQSRLATDPTLKPKTRVPFYFWRGRKFVREEI